jgi:uncharacterized protein (TIRG00374 family)
MTKTYPEDEQKRPGFPWVRLVGPLLFVILLINLDISKLFDIALNVRIIWVIPAGVLLLPQIAVKTIRWQVLMTAQDVHYPFKPAYLAYFASLFIGFLTPGRLGEFTKVLYVRQDCQVTSELAFSSVLADRLFDLYLMLLFGIVALANLTTVSSQWLLLAGVACVMVLPVALFLEDRTYQWIQKLAGLLGSFGKLFMHGGWLYEMRLGLLKPTRTDLAVAIVLNFIAYGFYFMQCFLLATALSLPIDFLQAAYAAALGGLVALIPVSISGLGTREAAIVAYLGRWGIPSEAALSYSLLLFATFYLGAGLLGALAWWIKPVQRVAGS